MAKTVWVLSVSGKAVVRTASPDRPDPLLSLAGISVGVADHGESTPERIADLIVDVDVSYLEIRHQGLDVAGRDRPDRPVPAADRTDSDRYTAHYPTIGTSRNRR